MDIYNPTNYVNNSEPDIDADNLNKTENKLEETVAKANEIIDALKQENSNLRNIIFDLNVRLQDSNEANKYLMDYIKNRGTR